jgi:hypothetical protein
MAMSAGAKYASSKGQELCHLTMSDAIIHYLDNVGHDVSLGFCRDTQLLLVIPTRIRLTGKEA